VELGRSTVESFFGLFRQPPTPTRHCVPALYTPTRSAILTTLLLSTRSNLPTARNQMLTIWINSRKSRMHLYRAVEFLPLDHPGV
jgi:hypothetical protein